MSSYQPLAKSKGVYRKVESEGSLEANLCPDEYESHQAQQWDKIAYNKSKSILIV
jgi:hypothetical protein